MPWSLYLIVYSWPSGLSYGDYFNGTFLAAWGRKSDMEQGKSFFKDLLVGALETVYDGVFLVVGFWSLEIMFNGSSLLL